MKIQKNNYTKKKYFKNSEITQNTIHIYLIVIFVSVICYVNSLNGEFVHDDIPAITTNADVAGETTILQMIKNDFWGTKMSDPNSHKSYRPLTVLSFRLTRWMCGLNPFSFHLGNLFLHSICTVLFTRVALKVARLQNQFSLIAGTIFACHPIHTEAVSGIVGRADILSCLLFLLSFLTYHDLKLRCWKGLTLSCILAFAAMLAKEVGLTVLLVNLLFDIYKYWPDIKCTTNRWKCNNTCIHLWKRALCLIFAMFILMTIRLAILQGTLPTFSNQDNPAAFHPSFTTRFLTYSYLATFNFWLLINPFNLSHDWQMGSVPLVTSLTDERNLYTCVFFLFLFWMLYIAFLDFENQRHGPLILAILFLIVPFLPASNLFFTVGFVIAERLLYIPSLGVILMTAYGGQILSQRLKLGNKLSIQFLFLILIFASRTIIRNNDWNSRESLLRAGLKASPDNAKLHYNWANYLRETGKQDESLHHYREALTLWPSYASAHNNLGTMMEDAADAESHFLSAIYYSPNHVNAHYNLGQIYRSTNRTEMAISMVERCLHLNSDYVNAYILLANLYDSTHSGNLLKYVTKIRPNEPNYLVYYAKWLRKKRRMVEAVYYYKRSLQLSKKYVPALQGLTRTYRDNGHVVRSNLIATRWRSDILGKKHVNIRFSIRENHAYFRLCHQQNNVPSLRDSTNTHHQNDNHVTCNVSTVITIFLKK